MTQAVTLAQLGGADTPFFRNRIINGDMRIDQRNGGNSVTPTTDGTYTLDRWKARLTQSSKYSVQQVTDAPAGFSYSLKVTSSSAYSVLTNDFFFIQQPIEGYNVADLGFGTANAKTVTLSFWVKSSLTGTFSGTIQPISGTRNYPYTYTISSANTWTQISVTFTGDTTGTWGTTNGEGISVFFGLGVGSGFNGTPNVWTSSAYLGVTGSQSVVGTSGATWQVTGVQLESGTQASPFERRPYGMELTLCQRYFEQDYDLGTPTILYGTSDGSSNAVIVSPFKVQKRTIPTMTYYNTSGTSGSWGYSRSGASGTPSTNNYSINQWHWSLYIGIGAAWAACNISGCWKAEAEL